ncbi:acyltransferase family protein [Mycetocola zhadangensis]|uniref:acyltransferase family protein n=1 Tax=Mycetocola zhadangensis TaxID=1164595 RepID=UPI003A4E0640
MGTTGREAEARRPSEMQSPGPTRAAHRRDIQGLRAVAVVLVVVFHLWPDRLPGGYMGVDVFFVLSGFLITSHLLREVERTGTVSLPSFWARRARRLLPAALTVLVVTVCAIWLVAPAGTIGRFLVEVMASAGYVENLVLASSAVDYLAAEAAPSPVQHFWSLSAEEQFYLVWPVLILVAVAVPGRLRVSGSGSRCAIGAVLTVVVTSSLIWSEVFTVRDPAPAYFLATTRAWEFGAGGLLAVVMPGVAAHLGLGWPRTRAMTAWLGLAAIAGAAVAFGPNTPFPGWAALLPVLGTVAVLAAAEPDTRAAPTRLLALRPVQRLGDLSYGIYLWHWPLIVLVPLVLGRALTVGDALAAIVATVALAAATERWVEKPVQTGVLASRRPRATFVAVAAAMAVVILIPWSTQGAAQDRLVAEQGRVEDLVDDNAGCLGAAALDTDSCGTVQLASAVIPDPSLAEASPDRCIANIRSPEMTVCSYGAAEGTGVRTLALVGDSHAEQWLPALAELATDRNWTVFVLAKSSCPFGPERRFEKNMSPEVLAEMNASCADWNRQVQSWFAEHPSVDTVLTATRARNAVWAEDGDPDWRATAIRQYRQAWAALPSTVTAVLVLRDTPRMRDDYLACLAETGSDAADVCAVDLEKRPIGTRPSKRCPGREIRGWGCSTSPATFARTGPVAR